MFLSLGYYLLVFSSRDFPLLTIFLCFPILAISYWAIYWGINYTKSKSLFSQIVTPKNHIFVFCAGVEGTLFPFIYYTSPYWPVSFGFSQLFIVRSDIL